MNKKVVAISTAAAVAVALLAGLGRWRYGVVQDANDRKTAMAIEKQYANRLPVVSNVASSTPLPTGAGGGQRWAGGSVGRGGSGQGGWAGRGGRGGSQNSAARLAEMTKAVGLSPTQAKEVQAVQESGRSLMGNIFRNPNLSSDQKRAQMGPIRAAQQAQINKILTPDQQGKYKAYEDKVRAQRQARRQAGGPGGSQGARP